MNYEQTIAKIDGYPIIKDGDSQQRAGSLSPVQATPSVETGAPGGKWFGECSLKTTLVIDCTNGSTMLRAVEALREMLLHGRIPQKGHLLEDTYWRVWVADGWERNAPTTEAKENAPHERPPTKTI